MGAQKRRRFVALVLCAAAAATSATTQHASPRNAATTLRRGGSNAPSPLDDLRSSLKELRAQAPITHGLLHTLLVTFVAAQHPRTQGLLRGHAVCCRQALRRGRAHVLLSHAVVTHDPYQLVFSIFALVVMAKPAEASLGTANFAKLALCSAVGGAAAAAAAQALGARGGVTGLGGVVFGCGAYRVLAAPWQRVSVLFVPRLFLASHVGAAVLAFDALMALCGHPGSAMHLGGAAAGAALHRSGLLRRRVRRWTPPPPPPSPALPPPETSLSLFHEQA